MSGTKISALTAASTPAVTDQIPIEQAAGTRRTTLGALFTQLLSFTQSGSGSGSARSIETELRELCVNVKSAPFGAKGDGTTDDATAFANALLVASGRVLFVPAGTYLIGSAQTLPANTLVVGEGKYASIIKKGFSGTLFPAMGSNAGFRDLQINGNNATYTGGSITISTASSFGQWIDNCVLTASSGYDVDYSADVGSQSFIINSQVGGRAGHTAIRYPTDTAACPRTIQNCQGGGSVLCDFGGANDFFFINNFTADLTFSTANSANGMIGFNRVATNGGTVTVDGGAHHIVGNIFAGPLVLAATAANCLVDASTATSWSITDNGTGNSVFAKEITYTPTWTGSVVNPALGNGTIKGRYTRNGNLITVFIDLTMGSLTTYGTGAWFFSLPKADNSAIVQFGGICEANAAGNTASVIAAVRVEPAAQKCSMRYAAGGVGAPTNVGAALPGAWANADTLRLSVKYLCA